MPQRHSVADVPLSCLPEYPQEDLEIRYDRKYSWVELPQRIVPHFMNENRAQVMGPWRITKLLQNEHRRLMARGLPGLNPNMEFKVLATNKYMIVDH